MVAGREDEYLVLRAIVAEVDGGLILGLDVDLKLTSGSCPPARVGFGGLVRGISVVRVDRGCRHGQSGSRSDGGGTGGG
jgi:hypothetical protein